jgi:hypothetical protein
MRCSQRRLAPPPWSTCRSDRQNTRLLLALVLRLALVVVEAAVLALLLLLKVVEVLVVLDGMPPVKRDT